MDSVPFLHIEYLVKSGLTYEEVSEELMRSYPGLRGLSARSVRRYCNVNGISHLHTNEIESLAVEAIYEVGALYGRRLMRGYLLSKGFRISERSVASALKAIDPDSYESRRQNALDRTNPIPYRPRYFGHKLHLDQNEKLTSFGVTTVVARDGYSGKIISFGVMPRKNNVAIYDLVYKKALHEYGLWDQVRVDHGREFYLILYIQDQLRETYGSPDVRPHVQSTSTENMPVERIWPEINSRVNYPIERLLISMVDDGTLEMEDNTVKFCVSFITSRIVHAGIKRFISAWNEHTIPRSGIPSQIAAVGDSGITILPLAVIPEAEEAAEMYCAQGGRLHFECDFGIDPLAERNDLVVLRDQWLSSVIPPSSDTFSNVVSGDGSLLKRSILTCIELTLRFTELI